MRMKAAIGRPPPRRSFLKNGGRLFAAPFLSALGGGASAQTFHDRRFRGVLRQEHDMSCGIASVRTLLAALGIDPPPERDLIVQRLAGMTPERAEQTIGRGFSLTDLREVLAQNGVQAIAIRGGLRQVLSVDRIGIVHLNTRSGAHFAVLHGLQSEDGRLVLLDPSRGRLALQPYQFEAEWTGVALLVVSSRVGSAAIRLDPSRSAAAGIAGDLQRMSNPVLDPQARP